jgi:hypothetical protein
MLNQPLLDIYLVRGFEGLIRMLEARTGPTTPQVAGALDGVRGRLVSILERLEISASAEPEVDVERLDRWLVVGAATFVDFIDARACNDRVPARLDLPIRAMIEKLTALQKQISSEKP